MAVLRRLTVVAGAAQMAREYVKRNPDKVRAAAEQAGRFVDRRTGGKYRTRIDAVVRQVERVTGAGTGAGTTRVVRAERPDRP
jgi:hypothetical protein